MKVKGLNIEVLETDPTFNKDFSASEHNLSQGFELSDDLYYDSTNESLYYENYLKQFIDKNKDLKLQLFTIQLDVQSNNSFFSLFIEYGFGQGFIFEEKPFERYKKIAPDLFCLPYDLRSDIFLNAIKPLYEQILRTINNNFKKLGGKNTCIRPFSDLLEQVSYENPYRRVAG